MKKYIIILAAVLLTFSACNKIELLDKPIIETLDNGKVAYTFTAVISDEVSEVDENNTKATVSRTGAFTWVVGDKLKFFPASGDPANAEVTAVDGSTATITVTAASPSSFVSAIYPADAAVANNQISFNARGPIVVAEVYDGGTLTFHHVGSLINIKFTGISGNNDIKSLVFTPSSAFGYDGTFYFSGDHKPVLTENGSTAKIVVPASNADNNTDITICVPPVNLSGFSAALNDNVSGNGRNLFKKSTATAHNLSDGPVLMNMQKVAYEAPRIYFLRTVDARGGNYWTANDIPLLKTGSDSYYALANVDKTATYYLYDEYNTEDPTTVYVKTGSVLDLAYSVNTFSLVGVDNWNLGNSSYSFNRIGNWNYIKNQSGLHNKSFKFNPWDNTSNWNDVWGSSGGAWFTDSVKEVNIIQNSGSENACGLYLSDKTVSIYLNTSLKKAYYRLSDDKNNPISSLVAFNYTPSTNSLTTTSEDDWGVVSPFNDGGYPTSDYCFISSMDDWTKHTMTYNNNWGWSYTFNVAAQGTYSFLFSNSSNGYSTRLSTTWDTSDVGGNGYGRLSYWDVSSNANVQLEQGTYTIYVNPTYNYDHSLNVQFIKQ